MFEQIEELKTSTPFHSIETASLEKIEPLLQKDISDIVLKKREKATSEWSWEETVQVCCHLDSIYFQLYYCWSTVSKGYQSESQGLYSNIW